MKLTVHTVLSLVGQIDTIFTKRGLYGPDGNFETNATEVASAAVDIEQALKASGLAINVRAERIIAAIPIVVALIEGE